MTAHILFAFSLFLELTQVLGDGKFGGIDAFMGASGANAVDATSASPQGARPRRSCHIRKKKADPAPEPATSRGKKELLVNGDTLRLSRLQLHAAGLRFPHPRTGVEVVLHAPLPEDMSRLWKQMGWQSLGVDAVEQDLDFFRQGLQATGEEDSTTGV